MNIKLNYIIRYVIYSVCLIVILMIINHYYNYINIRNKKLMGIDKDFINWSIDNNRSGFMTALYKYNCSDDSFKYMIENVSLVIKKSLTKGDSVYNKNIDFNNKKIVYAKKDFNDVVKIVDNFNEIYLNKFLNKYKSKQSILIILSKKNKLMIFNFDHAILDGLGTFNLCGDLVKLLNTSKINKINYIPVFTEFTIIYNVLNQNIYHNFRKSDIIYNKLGIVNYSFIKKSDINYIKQKYNSRFLVSLMAIYYYKLFKTIKKGKKINSLNVAVLGGFENKYYNNNFGFNLIKIKNGPFIDILNTIKNNLSPIKMYSSYFLSNEYQFILKKKLLNYKIDSTFSILFNEIFDPNLNSLFVHSPFTEYPLYTYVNSNKSWDYCTVTTTLNNDIFNIKPNNIDLIKTSFVDTEIKNIRKNIYELDTEQLNYNNNIITSKF